MDRRDSNSPVGCMHASASDNDMEGHFSAATTQPSSPRSFLRAGSPQMKNAPWVQVQDRLLKFAEEGDADVDACGELVSCQIAIERFLHGNKDNVEKAAQQMRAHFRWRREERIDCVIHEDFSDLETCEEL
ncbi:hypothetical protein T484DRAFT_1835595 [Baffinella frigidus]|nr:hypothetical protein T484DRAFT_1835595 [Cryptophyta sp. CCMP2293]